MDSAFLLGAIKELGDQQAARRAEARAREDAENKARAELLQHVWDATVAGKFSPVMYGIVLKDQMALANQGKRPTKKGVGSAFSWDPEPIQGGLVDALLSGEYDAPSGGTPAAAAPSAAPSAGSVPEASSLSMTSSVPPPPLAAAPGTGPSRGSDSGSALRFSTAPDGATFTNRLFAAPPTPPTPRVPLANFGAPSLGATIPPPPVPAPPQVQPAPRKFSDFVVDPVAESLRVLTAKDALERKLKTDNINKAVADGLITPQEAKPFLAAVATGVEPKPANYEDLNKDAQPYILPEDWTSPIDGTVLKKGTPVTTLFDRATAKTIFVPVGAKKPDAPKFGAGEAAAITSALKYPVNSTADIKPGDEKKAVEALRDFSGKTERDQVTQLRLDLLQGQIADANKVRNAEPFIMDHLPNTTTDIYEPHPVLGLTPAAIANAAIGDILGIQGSVQNTVGRAQKDKQQLIRDAILNSESAMLAKTGMTGAKFDLQQAAKAGGKALANATNQYVFTKAAADATSGYLDNVLEQSKNVPRGQSPLANRIIQVWQKNGEGYKDLSVLEQYIYTAVREYQKVVTGSPASNAPLTDTASKQVDALVNTAQNPQTLEAVVGSMRKEMDKYLAGKRNAVESVTGKNTPAAQFLRRLAGDTDDTTTEGDIPALVQKGLHKPDGSLKENGTTAVYRGVTYAIVNGQIVKKNVDLR